MRILGKSFLDGWVTLSKLRSDVQSKPSLWLQTSLFTSAVSFYLKESLGEIENSFPFIIFFSVFPPFLYQFLELRLDSFLLLIL